MAITEHWAPTPPANTSPLPPPLPPPLPSSKRAAAPQPPVPSAPPLADFAVGDQQNVAIASEQAEAITSALRIFIEASCSHYAAVYSETGARIAQAGPDEKLLGGADEVPALAIGAFFATRELAGRLGESHFEGLYQQGAQRHIYLAPLGKSFILLTVFSAPTNVGIVRLCVADTATDLAPLLDSDANPSETGPKPAPVSGGNPAPALPPPPHPARNSAPLFAPADEAVPVADIASPVEKKLNVSKIFQPIAAAPATPPSESPAPSLSRPAPTGQLHQDTPTPASSWLFRALPAPEAPKAAPTIAGFQGGDPDH